MAPFKRADSELTSVEPTLASPQKSSTRPRSPALHPDFEKAFTPASVAVVGASSNIKRTGSNWRNPAGRFVPDLIKVGFPGKIYPVNPKADEIDGLKAYPNLSALPEVPDLVTVTVPARFLAAVLEECGSIGALNVHVFTSGLLELATESGDRLQQEVQEAAVKSGVRIIGPNCMGIHVPKSRLSTITDTMGKPGRAAFVAQSGGHAMHMIEFAAEMDLGLSKVISFGNAMVLEGTDYLEYLATDPDTEVIGMYLEGVKDGSRLMKVVREVNRTKPVIIWKGGLTESGSRAAASHTGSLAGQRQIWDAFFAQTGAIQANSVEEVGEVMRAFTYLPPIGSNRAVLVGAGGGNNVAAADICSQEGLDLTLLSPETSEKLRGFVPDAGNSVRNPLDLSFGMREKSHTQQAVEIVSQDEGVDSILVMPPIEMFADSASKPEEDITSELVKIAGNSAAGKPLIPIISERLSESDVKIDYRLLYRKLAEAGILTYSSLGRAARALARFTAYHRRS